MERRSPIHRGSEREVIFGLHQPLVVVQVGLLPIGSPCTCRRRLRFPLSRVVAAGKDWKDSDLELCWRDCHRCATGQSTCARGASTFYATTKRCGVVCSSCSAPKVTKLIQDMDRLPFSGAGWVCWARCEHDSGTASLARLVVSSGRLPLEWGNRGQRALFGCSFSGSMYLRFGCSSLAVSDVCSLCHRPFLAVVVQLGLALATTSLRARFQGRKDVGGFSQKCFVHTTHTKS